MKQWNLDYIILLLKNILIYILILIILFTILINKTPLFDVTQFNNVYFNLLTIYKCKNSDKDFKVLINPNNYLIVLYYGTSFHIFSYTQLLYRG